MYLLLNMWLSPNEAPITFWVYWMLNIYSTDCISSNLVSRNHLRQNTIEMFISPLLITEFYKYVSLINSVAGCFKNNNDWLKPFMNCGKSNSNAYTSFRESPELLFSKESNLTLLSKKKSTNLPWALYVAIDFFNA